MAAFRDMSFTPAEFASIAKIDRGMISQLESSGLLKTTKKKVGNVDRKIIALEDMQAYFHALRVLSEQGVITAANPEAIEELKRQNIGMTTGLAPVNPVHKIQMFYNVKGGTGKSTMTAQYVMRAAMLGLKVLAIDLDGQGHLSVNLDVLDGHERPTIYDVLINDLPISEAIMNVAPCLDLIPANLGLCNIEIPLNNKTRREYRLSEALAKIAHNYDLIVADTNPAASILNGSMLVASGLVNVVCATNPLSFHGMSLVMATIETMEQEFSRKLEVRIIPNMYDNREVISQEVLGELRSQFSECCTRTVMNRTADINEATKRRSTVWDVNPRGVAAHDITSLTEELIWLQERPLSVIPLSEGEDEEFTEHSSAPTLENQAAPTETQVSATSETQLN
jgi:chromosome partitioning protein